MEMPAAEGAAAAGPAGQGVQGAEPETTVPGLRSVRSSGSGSGCLVPSSTTRTVGATQLAIGADAQQRLQQLSLQQQQNYHQQQQHDQLARDAGAFQAGDVAAARAPQLALGGQMPPPQQQQPHPDCQQRQEQEHQQHRDRQRDRDEQAQQLQQPQHHLHKQAHHQHEPQYQAPPLPAPPQVQHQQAPPQLQHQVQQLSQQSAGSELEEVRDRPHGQGHSRGEAARPAVSVEQHSSASHPLAHGGQSARHKRHRGQQQDSGSTMSQSPAHMHGAQQHGSGGGAPCGADGGGSVRAAGAAAGQGLSRTTSGAVQQAQSLAAQQQQQHYGNAQGKIRPDMGSSSGAAAPGPLGQQQYLPQQQLQQPAGLSLQQLQHFGQAHCYPQVQGQGGMLPPGVNPTAAGFPSWLSSILQTQYTGKHGLMQHICGSNGRRAGSLLSWSEYAAKRLVNSFASPPSSHIAGLVPDVLGATLGMTKQEPVSTTVLCTTTRTAIASQFKAS